MRVFLAGSTGAIGREVAALLRAAGHELVPPTRAGGVDALRPETLRGTCDGMDVVVSAMGGSVALGGPARRPYAITNTQANRNLIAEALRARVRRFVYVAAHKQSGYEGTAYMQSHEAVVEELGDTKMRHKVIRPTGVLTALAPFVEFARKEFVPLIGYGSARTNPIAASDVARAVIENLADGPVSVSIVGPEVLTRRGIAGAAARALGKSPVIVSMPVGLARFNAKAAKIFNPRVGELMAFAAAVSVVDCVVPEYGSQRLEKYFAGVAQRL